MWLYNHISDTQMLFCFLPSPYRIASKMCFSPKCGYANAQMWLYNHTNVVMVGVACCFCCSLLILSIVFEKGLGITNPFQDARDNSLSFDHWCIFNPFKLVGLWFGLLWWLLKVSWWQVNAEICCSTCSCLSKQIWQCCRGAVHTDQPNSTR